MEDRYVYVGNVRTRYRAAGERGPALVLLHGLGASLEAWYFNIKPLGQHFHVFAPDIVWFGKSDKPRHDPTLEFFAQFIVNFMDAVGIKRATLVGNSMGGMIATITTLQYPERVEGLVLVNSAGFGRELSLYLRLRSLISFVKDIRPSRGAVRLALRQIFYDASVITEEMVDLFVGLGGEPGSALAYHKVIRSGVDWRGMKKGVLARVRDSAHRINVPTLVVWGKQDRAIPVAHAQVAQQRIPNAQLHIFDPCGHAPQLERANEFNELVTEFVQRRVVKSSNGRAVNRSISHLLKRSLDSVTRRPFNHPTT